MDRSNWSRRTILYWLLGGVGVAAFGGHLLDSDDTATNDDRVGYGTVGYGAGEYGD